MHWAAAPVWEAIAIDPDQVAITRARCNFLFKDQEALVDQGEHTTLKDFLIVDFPALHAMKVRQMGTDLNNLWVFDPCPPLVDIASSPGFLTQSA